MFGSPTERGGERVAPCGPTGFRSGRSSSVARRAPAKGHATVFFVGIGETKEGHMDAIQLLKSQHREVEQLFKAYEEQEDLKAVRQVLENLTIHAEIEEKVFYPAYKQAAEEKDIILESVEEHRLCKILISELRELSRDDERYDAKVTVLKELVEHHVEEEEKEMFPQAKKILGDAKLKELGEKMAELAEQFKGQSGLKVSMVRDLEVESRERLGS